MKWQGEQRVHGIAEPISPLTNVIVAIHAGYSILTTFFERIGGATALIVLQHSLALLACMALVFLHHSERFRSNFMRGLQSGPTVAMVVVGLELLRGAVQRLWSAHYATKVSGTSAVERTASKGLVRPSGANLYDIAKCLAVVTMVIGHMNDFKVCPTSLPLLNCETMHAAMKFSAPIFYLLNGMHCNYRFRWDLPLAIIVWHSLHFLLDMKILEDALTPILLARLLLATLGPLIEHCPACAGPLALICMQQASHPVGEALGTAWGLYPIIFGVAGLLRMKRPEVGAGWTFGSLLLWHTTVPHSVDALNMGTVVKGIPLLLTVVHAYLMLSADIQSPLLSLLPVSMPSMLVKWLDKAFCTCGRSTLQVYVVHGPVLYMLRSSLF